MINLTKKTAFILVLALATCILGACSGQGEGGLMGKGVEGGASDNLTSERIAGNESSEDAGLGESVTESTTDESGLKENDVSTGVEEKPYDDSTMVESGVSGEKQSMGTVLVLDPGHGGGYTGAVSGELVEKELTHKLAEYVKRFLEENYTGLQVFLTRDEDSALSGDLVEDLELRAEFAKEKNADALISLHLNASEEHDQSGCMVFVTRQAELNEGSTELAEDILNELSRLGIVSQGVKTRDSNDMKDDAGEPLDYYAINRHCSARGIPGIIVEHCYIDSETDAGFIADDDALRKLAQADAEGIAEYFGLRGGE